MQNSAVSFLTYSFSVSFFLRFRNSYNMVNARPCMHRARRTLTAYSFSSVRSHLCARRTTDVAPFPMATFSQTPYFFNKLIVLSPAVDLRSLSESDFLLLAVERPDVLRVSFGPPRSLFKSLRVNFCPVSDWWEWTEGGLEGGFDADFDTGADLGGRAVLADSGSGVLAE